MLERCWRGQRGPGGSCRATTVSLTNMGLQSRLTPAQGDLGVTGSATSLFYCRVAISQTWQSLAIPGAAWPKSLGISMPQNPSVLRLPWRLHSDGQASSANGQKCVERSIQTLSVSVCAIACFQSSCPMHIFPRCSDV